jgi:hypothetical protein
MTCLGEMWNRCPTVAMDALLLFVRALTTARVRGKRLSATVNTCRLGGCDFVVVRNLGAIIGAAGIRCRRESDRKPPAAV